MARADAALSTLPERVSVLETKLENVDYKLDDIKTDVRDLSANLTETLTKMQEASTKQHGELAGKIKDLEGFKNKWTYTILGGLAVLGWVSGHMDTITRLLGK
jgi:predicted  nucleic acid-binding Zn-ribbon protein